MPFDGRLLAGVSVLSAVIESGNFGRAAGVLGITTSQTPTMDLNRHGEWLIFY